MVFVPVAVHGSYTDYDGTLQASGLVTFTPLAGWVPAGGVDYVPVPIAAPITAGEMLVTLLAPGVDTDPDLRYQVDVTAGVDLRDTYTILMPVAPAAGVALELSSRTIDTGLISAVTMMRSSGGFGSGPGGF